MKHAVKFQYEYFGSVCVEMNSEIIYMLGIKSLEMTMLGIILLEKKKRVINLPMYSSSMNLA